MQANTEARPLISIVIPTFNREKWIGEAIESAMMQDYPNFEIVVCDDGSTDNSDEVIRSYCYDPRVKYFKNETNLGLISNFNKVFFELAQGEFVTLLGSDDYLINTSFLTKAVEIIKKYDNIALVFGKTSLVQEATGKVFPSTTKSRFDIEFRSGKDAFIDFAARPYYSSGAVLYNLHQLKNNNIKFSGRMTADIEMNLQLMMFGDVGYINETCYMVRQHSANASASLKNAKDVEFSYLDLIQFLLNKATYVFGETNLLRKWYRSVISINIEHCLTLVNTKGNRKQAIELQKLLLKKYFTDYLFFLFRNPKHLIKVILNK
jgi:glycosyltransferase involved in cell wall biosynthesis